MAAKSETEIDRLLALYDSICDLLSESANPKAEKLRMGLLRGLGQYREAYGAHPRKATYSQLRSGARQGLRDVLHIVPPLLAHDTPQIQVVLRNRLSAIERELAPKKKQNSN